MMLPTKKELRQFPVLAPLFAAVFAPLSTLLDIPALTEPWFFQEHTDGLQKLPDPTACLTLSAIGLTFNVLANGLLIARFSTGERGWQLATKLSMGCWIIKVRTWFSTMLDKLQNVRSQFTSSLLHWEMCLHMDYLLVTNRR